MRVIHLPTPVGGNAWGLSRGERALGLRSDVHITVDSQFHYPADRVICQKRPDSVISAFRYSVAVLGEIYRIRKEYDVFHFNFGRSVVDVPEWGVHLLDLPLYKGRGKICVTYNGCDARQKYPTIARCASSACHNPDCYGGICINPHSDYVKQKRIRKFARYADAIFALNPDLLHFLPERARFLPYTIAAWNDLSLLPFRDHEGPLNIVHAPSDRGAKGTDCILSALRELNERYPGQIKVRLIENLPYQDALQAYREADLVIDQILIGWYGAVAVEAMKMGRPVMAYIREEDLHFIPSRMADDCLSSVIDGTPRNIAERLSYFIEDPSSLQEYHRRGSAYVETWHDPVRVARITMEAYNT